MNSPLPPEYSGDPPARRPIAELIYLAGPTIAQMISYTLMQFIDAAMLSHVGTHVDEPTAATNAGLFAFALISLGMGTLFIVNTLVSQKFGAREYRSCGQYLWQGVWFSIIFGLLILPLLPFLDLPFRWMGHDPLLASMETSYLRIVAAFAVLKLVDTAFGQFMLAINRPVSVLMAAVFGVAANAIAAWVLIFGHWGLPQFGVVGSAWAQNIGVLVEMIVVIALAMRPMIRRKFNALDWRPRLHAMRTLLRVGLPAGVQVFADVMAWSLFSNWVMAQFGTDAMAANVFTFRYMSVSFMPVAGIQVAVVALVGRYIGMKRPDLAMRSANLGFGLAALYMLGCGMVFILGRYPLIRFFTSEPAVIRLGVQIMVIGGLYQLFDAMYMVYRGGLQGAGDTLIPAIATLVSCWGITVLGGWWIGRTFPQMGPLGPWLAALLYGILLGLFMLVRFRMGRWRRIHLEEPEPAVI
jgi:MATE family multidrug resistance protein